jgi:hypothetical protein
VGGVLEREPDVDQPEIEEVATRVTDMSQLRREDLEPFGGDGREQTGS